MAEEKDNRSFFQVVYDIFGYAPGGGDRKSHLVTVGHDKEGAPIVRQGYVSMIKRQSHDPDFAKKIAEIENAIASGTLACKVITGVEVADNIY